MQPHAAALNDNSLQQYGCHHKTWETQSLGSPLSRTPLVMNVMFSLDNMTSTTLIGWLEIPGQWKEMPQLSLATLRRQNDPAALYNLAAAHKCLPGSLSCMFRLQLEPSLSHILPGRKTHKSKRRFQEALEQENHLAKRLHLFVTLCVALPMLVAPPPSPRKLLFFWSHVPLGLSFHWKKRDWISCRSPS